MTWLIWVFAGRTSILLVLSWGGSDFFVTRNKKKKKKKKKKDSGLKMFGSQKPNRKRSVDIPICVFKSNNWFTCSCPIIFAICKRNWCEEQSLRSSQRLVGYHVPLFHKNNWQCSLVLGDFQDFHVPYSPKLVFFPENKWAYSLISPKFPGMSKHWPEFQAALFATGNLHQSLFSKIFAL